MSIKVLLADNSAVVRHAIRVLLGNEPEIKLVGEAADYPQTIQMMVDLKPEVTVLDLNMPGRTQAALFDVKSHLSDGSRLLAISFLNDEDARTLAENLGAVGFLDKVDLGLQLVPTIMQVVSSKKHAPAHGGLDLRE